MNTDLAMCAKQNFEYLAEALPDIALHPYYRIAMAQLDEALGGISVKERFALDVKRPAPPALTLVK